MLERVGIRILAISQSAAQNAVSERLFSAAICSNSLSVVATRLDVLGRARGGRQRLGCVKGLGRRSRPGTEVWIGPKTALWRRSAGDAGRPRRCAAPPSSSALHASNSFAARSAWRSAKQGKQGEFHGELSETREHSVRGMGRDDARQLARVRGFGGREGLSDMGELGPGVLSSRLVPIPQK